MNSSANDQMINLRNEVETLKAKLRVEQDARKTAQGVSKELQMKLDRLRIKVAQVASGNHEQLSFSHKYFLEKGKVRYQRPGRNSKKIP